MKEDRGAGLSSASDTDDASLDEFAEDVSECSSSSSSSENEDDKPKKSGHKRLSNSNKKKSSSKKSGMIVMKRDSKERKRRDPPAKKKAKKSVGDRDAKMPATAPKTPAPPALVDQFAQPRMVKAIGKHMRPTAGIVPFILIEKGGDPSCPKANPCLRFLTASVTKKPPDEVDPEVAAALWTGARRIILEKHRKYLNDGRRNLKNELKTEEMRTGFLKADLPGKGASGATLDEFKIKNAKIMEALTRGDPEGFEILDRLARVMWGKVADDRPLKRALTVQQEAYTLTSLDMLLNVRSWTRDRNTAALPNYPEEAVEYFEAAVTRVKKDRADYPNADKELKDSGKTKYKKGSLAQAEDGVSADALAAMFFVEDES